MIMLRGMTTRRSSDTTLTPAGSRPAYCSVMSRPITAMSPLSNSQMSGHEGVALVPPSSKADFPSRRRKLAAGSASQGRSIPTSTVRSLSGFFEHRMVVKTGQRTVPVRRHTVDAEDQPGLGRSSSLRRARTDRLKTTHFASPPIASTALPSRWGAALAFSDGHSGQSPCGARAGRRGGVRGSASPGRRRRARRNRVGLDGVRDRAGRGSSSGFVCVAGRRGGR